MKHTLFSFLTLSLLLLPRAHAQAAMPDGPKEKYFLGVILGQPTGLSGKMRYDAEHSWDAAIAGGAGRWDGVHVHADYLWDPSHGWETKEGPIFMYYGLGGRVISVTDRKDNGKLAVGPRGSLGVTFNVNNPNLEIFGEGAFVVDVVPAIDVDLDLGIGARIRF